MRWVTVSEHTSRLTGATIQVYVLHLPVFFFFFFFCFFFSFRSAEKIKSCVIILWVPDSSFHFFLLHDDRFFLCDSLRNKSYFYSAGKSDSRDSGSYGPVFIINHLRGGWFWCGGGGGGVEGGHMVFRGEIGRDQSSPTDLTANKKGGHKISQSPMKRSGKFYRDTIKILRSSPSPSPPPLPRR